MSEKGYRLPCAVLFLMAAPLLRAEQKRPAEWLRTGELDPVPQRKTDRYPLSDQDNEGNWIAYAPLWDEFDSPSLDTDKWHPTNPSWPGRKPGWFDPANVAVAQGKLHLTMRKKEPPEPAREKGYHTYTCAAVQSKTLVKYGYFEARCKPMASAGSSSFWFYDRTKESHTEIDVFEIGGGAAGFEKKYNTNVHVFRTPTERKHWSRHGHWSAPSNLADDYHTYGLEWTPRKIKWYFDGVLIRWIENTHWHQPLSLNFDSETMPDWFGLPDEADLPSTFSIEYVRAWKSREQVLGAGRLILEAFGTKGKDSASSRQKAQYSRIFARMDRNSDGKLSEQDYIENSPYMTMQIRKRIFAASDFNKDGVLTKEEYLEIRAITDEARAIYDKMDADGDARLSKAEFLNNTTIKDSVLAEKIFAKLDANEDAELTIPEFLRTWTKWARDPSY